VVAFSRFSPLELGRLLQPFDHPEWVFVELKYDGFPGVPVFVNEDGGAIHFSSFAGRVWVPLRTAAKLPDSATLHGLRHTAARLLLGSAVDVRTAQGIIGHARGSTTLEYADYIPSNAERAMAGLYAMIASAESAKGA
jgi:integrase